MGQCYKIVPKGVDKSMYKTAIITDEVSQDFKTATELAGKYNLDGVELRSVYEKTPFEFDNNDIVKMKSVLSETDLEVCCIGAPFFKCSLDNQNEINQHIEGLKRCIELCSIFNTKLIRGFTFWNNPDYSLDERLEDIAEKFLKPIELLKQANCVLALEFDPTVYTSNAQMTVKVLEKINSQSVGALWDPGNDIYDPNGEIAYPNGYEIIKKHMVHMHLKDARLVNKKPEAAAIGCGDVDLKGQFKALKDDDYNGYVSLETHYRPAHELSEDILKQPKGSAFSYLGYEASEECLENWKRLMSEIK